MINKINLILFGALSALISPAHSIEASFNDEPPAYLAIWHSNSFYLGADYCSLEFSISDNNGSSIDIKNLNISITAFNGKGKKITSKSNILAHFKGSDEFRYTKFDLTGEGLCDEGVNVTIDKATTVVDGKTIDLIKTKSISSSPIERVGVRIKK